MIFHKLKIGDRVILSNVRHAEYRGKVGTVKKCIKSRQVIRIQVDGIDPKLTTSTYDAEAENIDLAGAAQHTLKIEGQEASCSCRMWSMFRASANIAEEDAKRNHQTHKESAARRERQEASAGMLD